MNEYVRMPKQLSEDDFRLICEKLDESWWAECHVCLEKSHQTIDEARVVYAKAVQNLSQPVPSHGWNDAIRALMERLSFNSSMNSELYDELWREANSLLDQQPKPENQESELDQCIDDYKKLWAVSPYDSSDNLAAHKGEFAFYIQNKYSAEIRDIAEDFIKADKRRSEWMPSPGGPE